MKKKLIQILMLLVATASVGSFVSCKDTNEDLYNDLRTQTATALSENASLRDALQEWAKKLQDQIAKYEELEKKLSEINSCNCNPDDITNINNDINSINGEIGTIKTDITDIKSTISGMGNDISNLESSINSQLGDINDLISTLTAALNDLEGEVGDNATEIAALKDLINSLTLQVNTNSTLLSNLTNLPETVADQQALIAVLQAEIANLKQWKETVNSCNCDKYTEVLETLAALQQEMTDAKDKVDAAIANATNLATAANTAAGEAMAAAGDAKVSAAEAKATAESAKEIAQTATTAAQNALDFAHTVEQKADQAGLAASAAQEMADKAWALAAEALVAANTANALATQVATLTEAVAANTANIASNKEAIDALKATTETIFNLIKENKTELQNKIDELNSRVSANESGIAVNAANIASNANKIAENASKIDENAKAIAQANQDIINLSAQIDALNKTISTMSEDIQKAFNEASVAAGVAAANTLEITALKLIIEQLQKDIADLQNASGGSNPATDTEIQNLKETTQNLQASISQLEQELNSKINNLSEQTSGNTNAITQLQTALVDLKEATGKTDKAVEDLTERVNDLLDRLSTLEGKFDIMYATCAANLEEAKQYADLQIELAKAQILNEVKEMLKEYLKNGDVDLSNYVTKEEVANFIAKEELEKYATKEELANYVTQDMLNELNAKLELTKTELEAALEVAILNITNEMTQKFLDLEEGTIAGLRERIAKNEADIDWLKKLYTAINNKVGNLEEWKEQIEIWKSTIETKLQEAIIQNNDTLKEQIYQELLQQITQDINTRLETIRQELSSEITTIIESYGFLTEDDIEDFLTAEDIKDFLTADDIKDFVTAADVEGLLAAIKQQLEANTDAIDDHEQRISNLEDATAGLAALIAKVNLIESTYVKIEDLNDYAKKDDLKDYIKTADLLVLLNNYAGKQEFNDFKQQVLDALQNYVSQDKITEIESKITALENALNNINLDDYASKQDLATLKNEINSSLAETLKNYVTNDKLTEYLVNYVTNDQLNNYASKDTLDNFVTNDQLDNYVSKDTLSNFVTNDQLDNMLNDYVTNGQLTQVLQGYATVGALSTLSNEINEKLNNYLTITAFNDAKQELLDKINSNATSINEVKDQITSINSQIETIKTDIQGLQTRVKATEDKLNELQTQLNEELDKIRTDLATLQNNLAKQVTSIMVQGTKNPWFGTFSLPFNVQSNILIAFYGVPKSEVEFPTSSTANYVRAKEALTDEDMQMLGLEEETLFTRPAATTLMYENGYAGKIYMTINPNTVDVTGLQPVIVNSLDEESLITLTPIQPSTEKLQFGFTRANNGFYEADAVVTPGNVQKVNSPTLETGAIADAIQNARDAIEQIAQNQSTSGSGVKLENIASDINKIVNGMRFDRSGLKCSYTTTEADGTEKVHSVYSEYNLAATAFKPLSLETAKDFNYVTIPGYEQANSLLDRLSSTVHDKVHVFFKDINNNGLIEKIVNLQINDINVPDLSDDLLAKFELHMDTVFIMGGLEYHLNMPIDVEVPVKFDKELTIPVQINGITVTVPVHVEQDVAVDLKGVTVTSPTVVVTGTATGTANAGAVLDPETGLPVFDGDGNIELKTVLRVPVCDNEGNVVGYTDVPLDDIHVSANISASGSVGDGEISLEGSPIAHVVIDDEFSTTINIDENVSYHLVIEDTFTKHIDISKYIQLGYVDYLRDPNEQDGYAKDENGNLIPLKDENGNPIPGDKRGFILRFNYDMRDAAKELWGMAADALTDVNKMMADLRDIIDEVNNLLDQINSYESKITNMVDNYIDKIRSYLDKINSIIIKGVNNTNQLFQPFMVASTSKGTKRLSGSKNYPTVLSSDVRLFATSKTMELFVPLARKHIGVTNVFKGTASAQGGDRECKARLNEANTGKINTLLDGNQRIIEVNTLKPGYVYEFAYSALDFHGKMATRKYYITIQ